MTSTPGTEICHCLAARRNARYLSRLYDRYLSAARISVSQFSVLVSISEHPDISISELAKSMVMERTTLVRALKPLQAEGFIDSRAEGQRFALRFTLSPAGKAKVSECEPYWAAAQNEYESSVGRRMAVSIRESLLASVNVE
ncbi:MarR family winged helix-turn-helix transcriptional regulator [Acerihabitans sp.]|uniref:MarR family winged helix-turn-helix transcriptional regulator n=1 Tax=Acerihabitans sp. TaxID=2811394 RepID=UPI002ED80B2A